MATVRVVGGRSQELGRTARAGEGVLVSRQTSELTSKPLGAPGAQDREPRHDQRIYQLQWGWKWGLES